MPTITVNKKNFFRDIGRTFTDEEFFAFCFQYGLELDEDTEKTEPNSTEPPQLKIEIPANRYDLLCHEGLVRAINIYLGNIKAPNYRLAPWDEKNGYRIKILPETKQVRQYAGAAILRGVKFTPERYASFIDLQDKLHMNIARKRTLVAIGTHDLSKVAPGLITYEAHPPEKIEFVPLNETKSMTTKEMMDFYADSHIKRFLPIIKDSPVYPVFYDSARTVLSFPPIINGDFTKIKLDTQDVLIEVTGLDEMRLNVVLNVMVTMFGQYASEPFVVEPVLVTDADGNEKLMPNLASRKMHIDPAYVNSFLGLSLSPQEICDLLAKMGHEAVPEPTVSAADPNAASSSLPASKAQVASSMLPIRVNVPPTRSDILHPVDLVEDAAVAYDFNKLEKTFPKANTIGGPLKINQLADIVRRECAMSGWVECIAWLLCSKAENFDWLNRKDDGKTAVVLENPKTAEYEIVRTTLLPGILKCVRENRKHSLPLKLYEVGDVVWKDEASERKASSGRRVAAIYCDRKSGFEVVHGLLDRIMKILDIKLLEEKEASKLAGPGYYIKPVNDDTFFPGRSANIYYRPKEVSDSSKDICIGQQGILHPDILGKYELDFPCSVLEFDLWPLL